MRNSSHLFLRKLPGIFLGNTEGSLQYGENSITSLLSPIQFTTHNTGRDYFVRKCSLKKERYFISERMANFVSRTFL